MVIMDYPNPFIYTPIIPLYFVFAEEELVTPPLDGIILPGVTRQSILDLARKWVGYYIFHTTNCDICLATAVRLKE